MTPDVVTRLARLDSCAVSDSLDHVDVSGVVLGLHPMWTSQRVAGRIVTVQLHTDANAQPTRHLGTAAVDTAAPDDVIVVANSGRTDVAGWGGILSIAARTKGVAGVIVDGACRDVDQAREVELPLYARAAVPVTARGRIVERSFNEPVRIGSVDVHPGDFVVADTDGVVFVPSARVEEVLRAAEVIMMREARMASDVRAGRSASDVMGRAYEEMLRRD